MDFHEAQREEIRRLEREVARLELRMEQEFGRRTARLAAPKNPRMAVTIADGGASPTYPVQGIDGGNTFPIAFVSAGYTHSAGRKTPQYRQHRTTKQTFVNALSNNWIPPGTYLQVWQDRGTDLTYQGEWWTDYRDGIRYGKASANIPRNSQAIVREWLPNNYAAETNSGRNWLVRNLITDLIEAGTLVFFAQIGSVAYAVDGDCFPE